MTSQALSRRHILRWAGAAAGVTVAGALLPNFGISAALAADLGGGDTGVLNYAYALEQLEAAFYTQVLASPYSGMTDYEQQTLSDIRDHEVAHVKFFRGALGRARIPDLEVDFSKVDFSSRRSVLGTAQVFEDTGVLAYNGAGQLLTKPANLAAAGTIVSVEGRHASAIRDMLKPGSAFAVGDDVINTMGLDGAFVPSNILPKVAPFIVTPVTANQLP
jgi:hypothetical protein